MTTEITDTAEIRRKRRMKRKIAAVAAGLVSISGAAGATVLVQNFMSADFNAAPPCLTKTAGTDAGVVGFAFDGTATMAPNTVDGLVLSEELVTIDGLTGDRVQAMDVFQITNNCGIAMDVQLASADQAGDWSDRYLAIWLGTTDAPTSYPSATADWDGTPLVFENGGPTTTESGVVNIADGGSVSVGVIATVAAGAAQPGNATASWIVQAES